MLRCRLLGLFMLPFILIALLVVPYVLVAQEPEQGETEPALKQRSKETAGEESGTVVIPAGTHLPLVLQNSVSTKTAEPGDPLYFETTYPIVIHNHILIPAGSFVRGTLTHVKRPGRIRGRGELHVRFDQLTLPNGYTVDLSASLANTGARQNEEVVREEGKVKADSSKGEDVGTIATTTTAGAGIGAIAGRSGSSAAIGAGAGAAAGLAAVLLTRGRELELPRGTTVDIVFDRSLELDAKLAEFDWTGQPSSLVGPDAPERRSPYPRIPRF